jgi:phosphoenolpyruvate carboxykinase (ATP)
MMTYLNLNSQDLVKSAIASNEGTLASNGALAVSTGHFTGRSPQDKFIVEDEISQNTVFWGPINQKFKASDFDNLYAKMQEFLKSKNTYVRYAFAGADKNYRLNIKVTNTLAWHNLFCLNMFIEPSETELKEFVSDFEIICIPEFKANPETDGTRSSNFSIIDLKKRILLIGGTGYAGEMKKGIFSALNFLLPINNAILPMHCSATEGKNNDVAIYFGLSGTGKTTLSADPNRYLIGDDEHGWSENGIFNFEGGCYAKTINLSKETEPDIFNAIKKGAILENTVYFDNTNEVNFKDKSITQNTRTAYPLSFIPSIKTPSIGGIPKNIFYLAYDAYGVLPPISKLNQNQAMYHFLSGYTSKVAGTEMGITEPVITFSACFGEVFMPLNPLMYAQMLGEKINKHNVNVWLINTGIIGGKFGIGSRMSLPITRKLIDAALNGELNSVEFQVEPYFGFNIPKHCKDVPSEILYPKDNWASQEEYDETAKDLIAKFRENFSKYDFSNEHQEILKGGPIN